MVCTCCVGHFATLSGPCCHADTRLLVAVQVDICRLALAVDSEEAVESAVFARRMQSMVEARRTSGMEDSLPGSEVHYEGRFAIRDLMVVEDDTGLHHLG